MAGASMGDSSGDNPLPINVVPMVDVIFCLCIFFFCSFHFRQLEGKMESWLPRDRGQQNVPVKTVEIEDIRIFIDFNPNATDASQAVTRRILNSPVTDDNNFRAIIQGFVQKYNNVGLADVPVIIDADPQVPWKAVVNVLSLCRMEKLEKLQFAAPRA